jgi:hypothetical protein
MPGRGQGEGQRKEGEALWEEKAELQLHRVSMRAGHNARG